MSKARKVSPSLKMSIQLKIAKVIEVIGGKQIKIIMMTDIIRLETICELFLINFHSSQKSDTIAMAIIGKMQAMISLMNIGLV